MFGQYKKQTKLWEGVLTGKGGELGSFLSTLIGGADTEQAAGEVPSFVPKPLAMAQSTTSRT